MDKALAAMLGVLAAIASGCVELWMGFQTHPLSGNWSSRFFWLPLPLMLAASLVLLAGSLVVAFRGTGRAQRVTLSANVVLAGWWIPVAVVSLWYHVHPGPLSTEGLVFPYFLVIPAVLVLASVVAQIALKKRAG